MSGQGDGDKTEKPTAKRLRDARKKGQTAKTEEAPVTVKFIIITFYLSATALKFFQSLVFIIQDTFKNTNNPFMFALPHFMENIGTLVIQFLAPLGIMLFIGIVASFLVQVGFLFVFESIKPSLKKISPIDGFKKLFSKKSLFGFIKNVIRVIILLVVFYYLFKTHKNEFVFLTYYDIEANLKFFGDMLFTIMMILIIFSLIITVVDYVFEKSKMTKELMMSKSEIKREFKDTEGNPEIKSKRKELHQEIQSGSLSTNVKKSSAVVKNPTHIAVCLYYKIGETPLPIVLEKGKGVIANKILQIAEENNIPIVTNISVARELYSRNKVGDFIPRDLMVSVAIILRSIIDFSSDENDDDSDTKEKLDDDGNSKD